VESSKLEQAIQVASSALSLSRYRIGFKQRKFIRKKTKRKKRRGSKRELEQSWLCRVAFALANRNTSTCINREEKTRTRVLPLYLSHPFEIQNLLLLRFYPHVESSSGWAIRRRYWRILLLEWQITVDIL